MQVGERSSEPIHEGDMTTFDKREEGFEKQFAHDEELRFKATARRNKLLGLWAAEKLGVSGPAADAYAKEVVAADFEEPGDADVFRQGRRANRPANPPGHGRADDAGGRADQSRQIAMANLPGYSLARRLAAGET